MTKEEHEELLILKQAHAIKITEIDIIIDGTWSCRSCKYLSPNPDPFCRSGFFNICSHPEQPDSILKTEAGNHVYATGCPLHEKR